MSARHVFAALALPWLAGACSRTPAPAESDGPPRLILLVSIDTLRADRLGAYGDERGLSPHIDALAAQSTVFEHAFAPASFTLPSVSALLTGLYPEQTGIYTNEYTLPDEIPTLAELARGAGYATGAVVANWVLRRATGLDQGFDHYDDRFTAVESRGVPEERAIAVTDDALAMLDLLGEAGERRFLWVHYQDPHGPYTPPAADLEALLPRELAAPDGTRELGTGGERHGLGELPAYQVLGDERRVGYYRAAYEGEIRFLDREIGRLLDGLRERDLWDVAAIVLCADHGEGLGENDYWFAHGELLTDPLVHVPLLVRVPGRAPARRSEAVGLVDVLPTLAALAGAEPPPDTEALGGLAGLDLLAPGDLPPRALLLAGMGGSSRPRYGYVTGRSKLLTTLAPDGTLERVELYPLGDESTNLAVDDQDLARQLLKSMATYRETWARPRYEAQELEPTAEDLENLRKLGYLE